MLVLSDLLSLAFASAPALVQSAVPYTTVSESHPLPRPGGAAVVVPRGEEGSGYVVLQFVDRPALPDPERATGVITAVDFDGDGVPNLLGAVETGLSDTYRDLSLGRDVPFGRVVDPCLLSAVGDWNGDGREDLASPATVWISDGRGFSDGGQLTEAACAQSEAWGLGDIDSDGADDLLVYSSARDLPRPTTSSEGSPPDDRTWGGRWALFASSDRRDGAWAPRWTVGSDTLPVIDAVAPVDVDRDGVPELAAYLESGGDATSSGVGELVLLGDLAAATGPRELARGAVPRTGSFAWGYDPYPRLLAVGDWDGDGDDDVLVETPTLDPFARLVLDADLDGPARIVDTLVLGERAEGEDVDFRTWPPVVADVSGDGALDVVYGVQRSIGFDDPTAYRAWFTGPGRDFPTALVAPTTVDGTQQRGAADPRGCAHAPGAAAAALLVAAAVRRTRSR